MAAKTVFLLEIYKEDNIELQHAFSAKDGAKQFIKDYLRIHDVDEDYIYDIITEVDNIGLYSGETDQLDISIEEVELD